MANPVEPTTRDSSTEKDIEKQRERSQAGVTVVNASGHVDELQRQYGVLSICSTALTIDNAWVAMGGSITIAILNGGPPGVIYEFIAACFYYAFIAASIAELASAIPSAGGVYHWASVIPGPRWGRVLGFFTGALNFYSWIFDLSSIAFIPANVVVQMYAIFHPDLVIEAWHVFVAFVLINILCCATVIFGNRFQPALQSLGLFMVVAGGLVTVIVLAAMPNQHASSAFVWRDWVNQTGWSGGAAFLTGMLNGAFTIGTPDSVTHMAEELPNPRRDLPKAIAAQISLGTLTGLIYAIAVMYAISDLDAVTNSNGSFPIAVVYAQATGSKGGTFGLLFIVFVSILICTIGTYITCGRIFWALARDNVTPFSKFFSKVSRRWSCPIPATLLCLVLSIALGAISLGSKTAFTDLVGSFIILSTISFLIPISAHLLTNRRAIPLGPFRLTPEPLGYIINSLACLFIVFTVVIYCLPYGMPATVQSMNYNSVILVGCVVITAAWWIVHGRTRYDGPKLPMMDEEGRVIADGVQAVGEKEKFTEREVTDGAR